ncbi:MAG: twin transmembrane helix small protein [Proteobacteria bacterium]|nr:twin transmembrane helix small protein [Pseudomonadota bacterium]
MSQAPLYFLAIAAVLVVLVVLMIGLGGFTKGGEFNRKYSNKLMRLRIIAQAVAVVLILLYAFMRGTGG